MPGDRRDRERPDRAADDALTLLEAVHIMKNAPRFLAAQKVAARILRVTTENNNAA